MFYVTEMKLNNESIKFVNLLEMITGARVKDCFFTNERILFIVENGDIKKVVSNKGAKIKKFEQMTLKKIKIVEFSDNIIEFLKSYISPIKVISIELKEGIVEIKADNVRDRGILIGRDRKNIDSLKNIIKKYFDIQDIKVT